MFKLMNPFFCMLAITTVHQMLMTQSADEIARRLAHESYSAQLKSIPKKKKVIELEEITDGKL